MTKIENKLVKLKNTLSKLIFILIFFDRLVIFYQAWKQTYIRHYIKDCIYKNGKIIVPIIEEIFKLLMNRKSGAKICVKLQSTLQAFLAISEKIKEPKRKN